MNLLHLAPEVQETLLFLPRTVAGRAGITERDLRTVVAEVDRGRQRHVAWLSLLNPATLRGRLRFGFALP
jgi:hypothetical protein